MKMTNNAAHGSSMPTQTIATLPTPKHLSPCSTFMVVSAWNADVKALQWAEGHTNAAAAYNDQISNADTLNVSNVYLLSLGSNSARWELSRVWDADTGEINTCATPYRPADLCI